VLDVFLLDLGGGLWDSVLWFAPFIVRDLNSDCVFRLLNVC